MLTLGPPLLNIMALVCVELLQCFSIYSCFIVGCILSYKGATRVLYMLVEKTSYHSPTSPSLNVIMTFNFIAEIVWTCPLTLLVSKSGKSHCLNYILKVFSVKVWWSNSKSDAPKVKLTGKGQSSENKFIILFKFKYVNELHVMSIKNCLFFYVIEMHISRPTPFSFAVRTWRSV